jgi:hypothetical protein
MVTSCFRHVASTASSGAPKRLSERINEKSGYVQDAEGNWKPRIDRRSQFESKGESPYFKGDYAKKNYKAGDYAKKSWWGTKSYENKAYQGDTDGSRFSKSSRFDGNKAGDSDEVAREGGAYETGSYATGRANESGKKRLDHPSDAETDVRRRVFTPPAVIDWESQRNLNLQQTKSILGRE